MQIQIPGPPNYQIVVYCQPRDDLGGEALLHDPDTPFGRLAEPFFFGDDDDFRDETFKLVVKVAEGNFVVKAAIPNNKPTILGKKIKQNYFMGDGYMELDLDVSSDTVAKKITGVAYSYAKVHAQEI
mmetsp:Transcript_71815/g.203332  ORF Transcript_71815/g.203332 Transcript_71815/m.203332 type:complete len:127 (+) Transcript_71815:485-865(+)